MSLGEEVGGAVNALVIDGGSSIVWLGQRIVVSRNREGSGGFATALGHHLYANFYRTGGPVPPDDAATADIGEAPTDTEVLSAANSGHGCVDNGWALCGRDGPFVVLEREGLRVWGEPGEIVRRDETAGSPISLRTPKERIGPPWGWYYALGDAGAPSDDAEVDRLYWNVRPEGRVGLVAALTCSLNEAEIPFKLKVERTPSPPRCDAGVLYTPRAARVRVLAAARAIAPDMKGMLRPRTPVFARPLAPGVAFAEDPPGDESFGEHRCRLLAEALTSAAARGLRGRAERSGLIRERWLAAGLSPQHPELNPGSDPCEVPAPLL